MWLICEFVHSLSARVFWLGKLIFSDVTASPDLSRYLLLLLIDMLAKTIKRRNKLELSFNEFSQENGSVLQQ